MSILSKIEWFEWDIWNPPYKMETSNFRGIVPIQFLISIILPIEWALDERYPTKLTFLCIMVILTSSGNMANMYCTKKKLHDNCFFSERAYIFALKNMQNCWKHNTLKIYIFGSQLWQVDATHPYIFIYICMYLYIHIYIFVCIW